MSDALGRRLFFRQAIGTVLAIVAAPKLPTLSALAPIIEIGTPLSPLIAQVNPPRGISSRHARLSSLVQADLNQLAQYLGLSINDLTGLLWRLEHAEIGLTDWTHHAMALSEVGKP